MTLLFLLGAGGAALAQAAPAEAPAGDPGPKKVRVVGSDGTADTASNPPTSDVARYCTNIADSAMDARSAIQTARLEALEAEVNLRIDELEKKRQEYQDWLEQRQAFLDSTSTVMIDIYASMRPDAAAAQLAGLDRAQAASLIAKLKARQASAILSEMPANIAAELGTLIAERTAKGDGAPAAAEHSS